jgi:hypothetical protein
MSLILRIVFSALATSVVWAAASEPAEAGCSWLEQPRYHASAASRAVRGADSRAPVSRETGATISPQIAYSIASWNCRDISVPIARKRDGNPSTEPQYQSAAPDDRRREAMLEIGALLGLLYLGFLACWVWATRLRRGSRH